MPPTVEAATASIRGSRPGRAASRPTVAESDTVRGFATGSHPGVDEPIAGGPHEPTGEEPAPTT